MKAENEVALHEPIHQKSWLMWISLILFPPVGVIFLWIQRKLSIVKKIILTIIAAVYFITPFILMIILVIIWNPTTPLFHNHDGFVEAFTQEVSEQDLPYSIQVSEEAKHLISSEVTQDITLLESIDENGNVQELIMIGQGTGTDMIDMIGVLIQTTSPELEKHDIGEILTDLRLFDENFDFNENEFTVEKKLIRYHLKYDESTGVIFSISKVN